jgi:DNA-binding transcriptional ArsR family regulator
VTREKVLEILRAISQPSRLEILRRIQNTDAEDGVTCTCVLEGLDISQSTASHHISELAKVGLITMKTQGRFSLLTVNRALWDEFQENLGKSVFG